MGFLQGAGRMREYHAAIVTAAFPAWKDQTCVPANATVGQVARVLVKFLEDNPNRLHEPVGLLYMEALYDAFPCKRKR